VKAPFVSVITPVFQTNLQYVGECIRSVAKQTYQKDNMELILSVDGSDQCYKRKLSKLAMKANQIEIRLIFNERNIGLSAARNRGVDHCQGDWLLILDSDDVIERRTVESLVNSIGSDTVMVYSDHARVSSNLEEIRYVRKKSVYHKLLRKYADVPVYNPIFSSVYISHGELIRKDALKKVGSYKKEIGEKPPVWISIFEMFGVKGIVHVPNTLYYYRENKDGIIAKRGLEVIRTHEQTFHEFIKKYDNHISKVRYIGRVGPFMVKHFAFYNQMGDIVRMPYIDYDSMRIIDTEIP